MNGRIGKIGRLESSSYAKDFFNSDLVIQSSQSGIPCLGLHFGYLPR